jgi:hypothetical protein
MASGALFQNDAKTVFLNVTRTAYAGMNARLQKKKLPPLPFDREEFREHVLKALDNHYDGSVRCRYCNYYFTIGDIAVDHAIPLSRGGDIGLDNLEYICKPCNNRKGGMTPSEYLGLLAFLESIPLARIEVLKRLEQSVKLAAGARNNAATINELRKSGVWQQTQRARREARKR